MLIISVQVWLNHLKLVRSKPWRNKEHTQAALGRKGGSRERVKASDILCNLASPNTEILAACSTSIRTDKGIRRAAGPPRDQDLK
jgi:hypothetical protein